MQSPYTTEPLHGIMAAQTSVAFVLGAIVWSRRWRPVAGALCMLAAIALAVLVPVEPELLRALGVTLGEEHVKHVLELSAAFATLGCVLTRRRWLVAGALVGEAAVWFVTNYIRDSDYELAAAHLAFFGLLIGLHWRLDHVEGAGPTDTPAPPSLWKEDLAIFFFGVFAATAVCRIVLHGWTDSADEWGYTYQAALFAKLRAYASIPPCTEAFRSFWVWNYLGRSFAQYTPGWPYFMAPFVMIHAAWLAGPVALGILSAGTARVTRRAAAWSWAGEGSIEARVAGRFGAAALTLSSTVLINGGSRFPHIFVIACFAWAIEALFTIATPGLTSPQQWRWGAVLGLAEVLALSTRQADAAALSIGLFGYFAYAVVRRRIPWRATTAAAIALGLVGGLTLVILRLQLGVWFKTGYSLNPLFYPWNKFAWSIPRANEFKWGFPLATGSYCWWPCSPAVGLLGLATLQRKARWIGLVLVLIYVPLTVFYTLLEVGRGVDFGYGPRYELPAILPMAIGTGVVLARLWTMATSHSSLNALQAGGPVAVALAAAAIGVARIAPITYLPAYVDVQIHNRLKEALERSPVHNAIVFGGPGLNSTDPMDITENLPLDVYPRQDVLIAIDRGPELVRCVREHFPTRSFYRAIPGAQARIVPF